MTTHAKATYIDDPDFTLYVGDVRDVLRGMPDESVHCVVTSPPYWGLRDYGTGAWDGGDAECDHQKPKQPERKFTNGRGEGQADSYAGSNLKSWTDRDGSTFGSTCGKCGARRVDKQLGLEPTPEEYVANMVEVFREVRRVLRRDGTCWLNIGDSYASFNGQGFDGGRGTYPSSHRGDGSLVNRVPPGTKPKDLVGIPWRLAFALQADGWYLRADIIWSKPNPMPESVTDRPTKAHEYVFLLTRSPRYFFDQEAVREAHEMKPQRRFASHPPKHGDRWGDDGWTRQEMGVDGNPAGRNVRSVWEIATQPYAEAHFATFPEALVERCVKAGTSERGCCYECGAPWEREVDARSLNRSELPRDHPEWRPSRYDNGKAGDPQSPGPGQRFHESRTTGWRRTCGHDWQLAISPCTVLDPFMGSGTTALVARRLGRKSIGIELNEEYARLAGKRLQQLSLLA